MLGTAAERQQIIATLEREGVDITQRVPEDWQRWVAQACGVSRCRVALYLVDERIARGCYSEAWARLLAGRRVRRQLALPAGTSIGAETTSGSRG